MCLRQKTRKLSKAQTSNVGNKSSVEEKHHPTTLTDPDIDYWKRDSAETRRIRQEEDAKDAEAYRNDPLLWDEESEYRC